MGMSSGWANATIYGRLSFLLIIVTNMFNFIGFCTSSWGIARVSGGDDWHTGLWRRCKSVTHQCNMLDGYAKVWFGVTQGFAVLGFAGVNLVFFLLLLYVFIDRFIRDKEVNLAASFICFITAVCWLIAVIVFGASYEDDNDVSATVSPFGDVLGYSFGVALVTLILEMITGIVLMLEFFYKKSPRKELMPRR